MFLLSKPIHSHNFHLKLFQNLYLLPDCFLELQTQMPSCQLEVSIWISLRYFDLNETPIPRT